MKVLFIPADKSKPFSIVEIKGEYDALEQKQELVGGNIEYVPLNISEVEIVVNEDGLAMRLPLNVRARYLVGILVQRTPTPDMNIMAPIVGDVFLCGPSDDNGNSTDVPEYIVDAMKKAQ